MSFPNIVRAYDAVSAPVNSIESAQLDNKLSRTNKPIGLIIGVVLALFVVKPMLFKAAVIVAGVLFDKQQGQLPGVSGV